MTWPSSVGFTPRSELRMAVSISPMVDMSYGLIKSMRGSGTEMVAIWLIGVGAP